MYKLANTDDSPHSLKIDKELSIDQKDKLWERLLESASAMDEDFIFEPILRNKIVRIRELKLSDTTLLCDKVKGFLQHKTSKTESNPHKIDTLFKRIRDSFAHGRIAQCNEYLILEDKKNELTGRIIITTSILLDWAKIIDDFIKALSPQKQ